jgi:hypothetical protein
MGIQKYVTRPEKRYKGQRRHSSFYVGQHLYHWLVATSNVPKKYRRANAILAAIG